MTSTKTRSRTKPASARPCKALLSLRPSKIDVDSIRTLVGRGSVATHAAIAREFGLSANTVKQSWAPEGMPGEHGKYPLAEIVAWRLRYLAELDERKCSVADLTTAQLDREQREEELRKIKLQNDRLEREEQEATGKVIDRASVIEAWQTDNAVLVERIKKLPRMKWATMLTRDQAEQFIPVFEGDLDREFIAHSEGRVSEVIATEENELDT